MMDKARIEDGKIVLQAHFGDADLAYPVEVLEAIDSIGRSAALHLEDAMLFYKLTKNAPSWSWETPESLEMREDLEGHVVYFEEGDYDSYRWSSFPDIVEVVGEGDNQYALVDGNGTQHDVWLHGHVPLLLVKLTEAENVERLAGREQATIWLASQEQERIRWEAAAKADADAHKNDPLSAWEIDLLGPDASNADFND